MAAAEKLAIKHELWRRGVLSWKFHSVQHEMHDIYVKAPKNSTLVWLLARQSGKSTLLALIACEQALQRPHSVIKLLTDTKLHARSIYEKIFVEVLEDCPEDCKPNYIRAEYLYRFPNGSEIQLAGTDGGHYERLRGQKTHLALIDEAGFCTNLDEIVKSVLIPTTTHTGGKVILASTPPTETGHDFLKFIEDAQYKGTLTKKTVYENPLLTEEQIARIEEEMGGKDAVKFKREYLCEIVKEEGDALFPEFDKALQDKVIKPWVKPAHYDAYVSMDLGGKDLTAVVFGYYDYKNDKVIIEDELVVEGKNLKLPQLTQDIISKEELLFFDDKTNEVRPPYKRISDINYIVTEEIRRMSYGRLKFEIPKKDDKMAAINNLRVLIASEKIIINPRCKTLIRHIENVKWDKSSQNLKFQRSVDDSHYDTVDALLYMVRSMNFNRNPYPAGYGYDTRDLFIYNKDGYKRNDPMEIYAKIFGRKRK